MVAKRGAPRRYPEIIGASAPASEQDAIIQTALHLACARAPEALPPDDVEATARHLRELALADPEIAAQLLDASVHLLDCWIEDQLRGGLELREPPVPPRT